MAAHVADNQKLSGLAGSNVVRWLLDRSLSTVYVTGVATNLTVEQTARHGTDLGFTVYVVSDSRDRGRRPDAGSLTRQLAAHHGGLPDRRHGARPNEGVTDPRETHPGITALARPAPATGPARASTTRSTGRPPLRAPSRRPARAGAARMPGGDDVAGVRAAPGDGRCQRRLQRAVEPVGVPRLQVIHPGRGRDLGLP